MNIHYIRHHANPAERAHLARINELRAAAIYGGARRGLAAIGALGAAIWAPLRAALARNATRRELARLTDPALRDIGLTRAEVESLTLGAAAGGGRDAGPSPEITALPEPDGRRLAIGDPRQSLRRRAPAARPGRSAA